MYVFFFILIIIIIIFFFFQAEDGIRDGHVTGVQTCALPISIAESEHDIMGAGHASTSIGYAVGIKEAMRRGDAPDGKVVAVIGDGAMTGGVAFEAVHQAGGLGTPMVVILNDNGMSISPNVGALSRYLNRVRLEPGLWKAREGVEDRLTKLPAGIGAAFERLGP